MSVTFGSLGNRRRKRRGPVLLIVSILMVLSSIGLAVFELVSFSQREERLPAGLSIAGVDVSNMGEREAVTTWERIFAQPLTLLYEGNPIILNPDAIGWRISNESMLAEAKGTSERASGFWQRFFDFLLGQDNTQRREVPLIADYQEALLKEFLRNIAAIYDSPPTKAGLDRETLRTFPGEPGRSLDFDAAMVAIDTALRDASQQLVILPVASVQSPQPGLGTLEQLIISYLDSQGFIYDGQSTIASVYIQDLTTGEEINILGDVAFSAASTMKLPIMVEFYRNLNTPPTQEEAWLMANSLLCSNNDSSNLIMQIVGGNDLFTGIGQVTNTAQYLGARNTYITAPFVTGAANQVLGSIPAPSTNPNPGFNTGPDAFNQTTAEDLGTILSLIYDCSVHSSGLRAAYANDEFTQNECRQMLELMSANDLERLLQGGLPPDVRISHKNGWIFDTVGDAGIVFVDQGHDYVISVFLWEETEFQDYEKLWPLVEDISRAAWNYFNPDEPLIARRTDLPPTAQECEDNYLPPFGQVNLDDINAWRNP